MRICRICGAKFESIHPTRVCCSAGCSKINHARVHAKNALAHYHRKRGLRPYKCRVCQTEFESVNNRVCCSERCRSIYNGKTRV